MRAFELRHAVRRLRAQPAVTVTALAALALGVGANGAVFALSNWVVSRPIPHVSDPGRLVSVEIRHEQERTREPISLPDLEDLGRRLPTLAGVAGYSAPTPVTIAAPGLSSRYLSGAFVSSNYFQVLGVPLERGRPFAASRDRIAGEMPEAVISDRLWISTFARRADVVGQEVALDGVDATIVGVAAPDFLGTDRPNDVDIWVPALSVAAVAYHAPDQHPLSDHTFGIFFRFVGRMATGGRLAAVRAQAATAVRSMKTSFPNDHRRWTTAIVSQGVGLEPEARDAAEQTLRLLAEISGLVLLIACANVAGLSVARALRARDAWRVRRALGATSRDLLRTQSAEAIVLGVSAAPLAALVAYVVPKVFRSETLSGVEIAGARIGAHVLLFVAGLALLAALASIVPPALFTLRTTASAFERPTSARMTRRGERVRSSLAALQIALSLSLLVAAFLLVATVRALHSVDVGFDAARVTTFAVSPALSGNSPATSVDLLRAASERIAGIPGVQATALSAVAPFSGHVLGGDRVHAAGAAASASAATPAWVSGSYFRVMGIGLLAGRTFGRDESFAKPTDPASATVILSHRLARQLFGSEDPLGRLVSTGAPPGRLTRVIGVVEDSRWSTLTGADSGPVMYFPVPRVVGMTGATFLIRSTLPVSSLTGVVQHALDAVAPSLPMFDAARLDKRIERTIAPETLLARLLTLFSVLATCLAAIGLYALMTFSVAERTKELGIRLAIGATPGRILALVARWAGAICAVGILVGLAGSLGTARLVASHLYGVAPLDPLAGVSAALLLIIVAAAASIVPALRAARIDPAETLRAE